jgi:hypothetical protein
MVYQQIEVDEALNNHQDDCWSIWVDGSKDIMLQKYLADIENETW